MGASASAAHPLLDFVAVLDTAVGKRLSHKLTEYHELTEAGLKHLDDAEKLNGMVESTATV